MNIPMEWLSPTPITNLALALAAMLVLVILAILGQQIRSLRAAVERQKERIEELAAISGSQIDRMEQQIAESEQRIERMTPAPANQRQISVATRNKILRLHRIGMRPEEIAEELDLKRGEVGLALKINGLILQSVGSEMASRETSGAYGG